MGRENSRDMSRKIGTDCSPPTGTNRAALGHQSSNLDKMTAQLHSVTTAKSRQEHTSAGKRCPLEMSSPQQ